MFCFHVLSTHFADLYISVSSAVDHFVSVSLCCCCVSLMFVLNQLAEAVKSLSKSHCCCLMVQLKAWLVLILEPLGSSIIQRLQSLH